MKSFSKILFLTFLSLGIMSCGSDDDDKFNTIEKKYTHTEIYKVPISGAKGAILTFDELPIIDLENVIGEDRARNLTRVERYNADCYVEIKGLKDLEPTSSLLNFSVKVGGRGFVNLGNCTNNVSEATDFAPDEKQSTKRFTDLIQSIIDTYTSGDKKARLQVSFKPTETIEQSDNVELVISIKADYYYNTYVK